MEINLAPEIESKLARVASQSGRAAGQIVQELIAKYLEHEEWFRSQIQKGLVSLDRGDFISDDEVWRQVERTLNA